MKAFLAMLRGRKFFLSVLAMILIFIGGIIGGMAASFAAMTTGLVAVLTSYAAHNT
jgi:hypothetical protein